MITHACTNTHHTHTHTNTHTFDMHKYTLWEWNTEVVGNIIRQRTCTMKESCKVIWKEIERCLKAVEVK